MKKKLPAKFYRKPKVVEVAKQSPSISRTFPVISLPSVLAKELFVGFVCGALVVAIGFSTVRLYVSIQEYGKVLQDKEAFLKQKGYWQSVISQFPDYRDAHFRLGVLAYQEGDKIKARSEVEKALQLDPSFLEGKTFLEKIGK